MIVRFSQTIGSALSKVKSIWKRPGQETDSQFTALWEAGRPIAIASFTITFLVVGGRATTLLERPELETYDRLIQLRPPSKPDPRLLVVAVTEEDIKAQKRWPLSDQTIHQLLNQLTSYQPRAIGLDIYRDIAHPPGRSELLQTFQTSDSIIAICKLSQGNGDTGVAPPPSIAENNVGFSDIVVDTDSIVRRSLLVAIPDKASSCRTPFSFAFQLARRYLAAEGIKPEFTATGDLKIDSTIFRRLQPNSGGYQNVDAQGVQILLNYRAPEQVAPQVTLTDVLQGKVKPEWVRDRVVLIGVTAPSIDDAFYTPYSARIKQNPKMPGVVVHAQIVSDLLSAVLDQRSLLWSWSEPQETLWIWGWALVGGVLFWRIRHPLRLLIGVAIASSSLIGISYGLLTLSGWVPLFAPFLSFTGTGAGILAYISYQAQQEREAIARRVEAEHQNILLLQTLLDQKTKLAPPPVPPPAPETPSSSILAEEATRHWEPTEQPNETAQQETAIASMPQSPTKSPELTLKPYMLGGRYKVANVLGAGGFARTYLAEDTQRPGNPECVIKHLVPARTDDRFMQIARRLFTTEAEILEVLGKHDRIPYLLAYFEQEQEFYLVEEFIKGHHLGEELPVDKRLPEAQVIDLLKSVLEVLSFIHDHQVIHRDLKPSNIIRRERDGQLCLIDFGAVKLIQPQHNDSDSENFTVAIGTKGYAPPEQLVGQPRLSSDIYALGMIAIQALTGIAPQHLKQDQNTGSVIWRHLANIQTEIADLLDKMVCYHFNERYQSAVEVLQALKKLPSPSTQVASPVLNYQPSEPK